MNAPKQMFEADLGIAAPWYVRGVEFDVEDERLTTVNDLYVGACFPVAVPEPARPVHHTVIKRLTHLNLFLHESLLVVYTTRMKLPYLGVVLLEPDWSVDGGHHPVVRGDDLDKRISTLRTALFLIIGKNSSLHIDL